MLLRGSRQSTSPKPPLADKTLRACKVFKGQKRYLTRGWKEAPIDVALLSAAITFGILCELDPLAGQPHPRLFVERVNRLLAS